VPRPRLAGEGQYRLSVVRRWVIVVASAAALLALSWPAVAPGELDSLPLSNYPMFAHERDRVTPLDVVVLLDPDGVEHRLDLRTVGGTDQPMQAAMTVRQAIRDGEVDELCAEVAASVDRRGTVQVVRVRHDAIAWFAGSREPRERRVFAACDAEGGR
jgi:hypothetical protein